MYFAAHCILAIQHYMDRSFERVAERRILNCFHPPVVSKMDGDQLI
jgi:hypothetical protein